MSSTSTSATRQACAKHDTGVISPVSEFTSDSGMRKIPRPEMVLPCRNCAACDTSCTEMARCGAPRTWMLPLPSYQNIYKPFPALLWGVLLATIMLSSLVLSLWGKGSPSICYNNQWQLSMGPLIMFLRQGPPIDFDFSLRPSDELTLPLRNRFQIGRFNEDEFRQSPHSHCNHFDIHHFRNDRLYEQIEGLHRGP